MTNPHEYALRRCAKLSVNTLQQSMTNLTCHNISSKTLTGAQKQVLGLGLNMVLQPPGDSCAAIQQSWRTFARSLRLRCQFGTSPAPRFRIPNPDFEPEPASVEIEQALDEYAVVLQQSATSACPYRPRSLSRVHLRALRDLKDDKTIVIKPADKNLGLTVMDAISYFTECMHHLTDDAVYVEQAVDSVTVLAELERILARVPLSDVPYQVRRFMSHVPQQGFKPALFYVLMKLHKSPPVGRPIAASHSWVTYNVSVWLDAELRALVQRQPTYLRDSTEFVLLLEQQTVPAGALLCTYDVTALYPSIPIPTALGLIHQMLIQVRYPKTDALIRLLAWVLNNSFVEFNGHTYKQKRGTAMGTPVAPAFATLFMSALDRMLTSHPHHSCVMFHRRFIDDGAVIWTGRREDLLSWLEYFNSLIPEINLTWSLSESELVFMDVRLYKGARFHAKGLLDMETYQKSLNKYLYVPFCSYHPIHCKKGFITSELKRYLIRSSDAHSFSTLRQLFYDRLRARGYPNRFLRPLFESVCFSARDTLLQRQRSLLQASSGPIPLSRRTSAAPSASAHTLPDPTPLVFKATYEPLTAAVRPRRTLQPLVDRLHALRPDIFGPRLITAWRLPKKVGQHLVRARFSMQ